MLAKKLREIRDAKIKEKVSIIEKNIPRYLSKLEEKLIDAAKEGKSCLRIEDVPKNNITDKIVHPLRKAIENFANKNNLVIDKDVSFPNTLEPSVTNLISKMREGHFECWELSW